MADVAQVVEELERAAALVDHIAARRMPMVPPGGTCIDCDDEIPGERRAAEPDAVRCLACQEKRERV